MPPELFSQPIQLPETQGNGDIQALRHKALALLQQAGWKYQKGALVHAETQEPFSFEYMSYGQGEQRFVMAYAKNLETVGIKLHYRLFDQSQFQLRLRQRDFDMVARILPQTFSPDVELQGYFHSAGMQGESTALTIVPH